MATFNQQGQSVKHQINVEPVIKSCQADRDGDCFHKQCPQLRDDEPKKTGRHCPLDNN